FRAAAGGEGVAGLIVTRAADIPPGKWTVPPFIRIIKPLAEPFPRLAKPSPAGNGPFPTAQATRGWGTLPRRPSRGVSPSAQDLPQGEWNMEEGEREREGGESSLKTVDSSQ